MAIQAGATRGRKTEWKWVLMKSRRESANRRICATEQAQGRIRPPPDRRAAPRPSRCTLRGIPSPASRQTARSAANGTESPRFHASDSHGSPVATREADRAPAQTQAHGTAKPTTARHPLIQGLQKATPRAPTARPAAAEAAQRTRRSPACSRTRRTARRCEAPSDYPLSLWTLTELNNATIDSGSTSIAREYARSTLRNS